MSPLKKKTEDIDDSHMITGRKENKEKALIDPKECKDREKKDSDQMMQY